MPPAACPPVQDHTMRAVPVLTVRTGVSSVPCRSIRSVQVETWVGTVAPAGKQNKSDRVGDVEARVPREDDGS